MQVIAIALGQPRHARRYCGSLAPSITCLSDEGKQGYAAYGLEQGGLRAFLSPDLFKAGARAMRQGYVGGEPIGDVRMLPGTFIINQGRIVYAYYSAHAGDHPPMEDLIHTGKSLRT